LFISGWLEKSTSARDKFAPKINLAVNSAKLTCGMFVFSLTHPAFNAASSMHVMKEFDDGEIKTMYSVKISRYMTPCHAQAITRIALF
jgi:hypothetical protein